MNKITGWHIFVFMKCLVLQAAVYNSTVLGSSSSISNNKMKRWYTPKVIILVLQLSPK
jgi:hypothetical protein